jgi:hypothetical protein
MPCTQTNMERLEVSAYRCEILHIHKYKESKGYQLTGVSVRTVSRLVLVGQIKEHELDSEGKN